MFGRQYAQFPQILMSSFGDMNHSYKKKTKEIKTGRVKNLLQKIYILLFGIPEIGFQLRSMYFEKIMDEKLHRKKLTSILDAGSGIGMYSFWLAKKFPNARVTGGDIDREKLKFSTDFAKKLKINNVQFVYHDVTKLDTKKERYDLIVTVDVLEHIENYKKVLKTFYTQLFTGGYVYIHTPQPNQKRLFKSLQKWEHEGHAHEGYTPEELKNELEKLGFKILVLKETFGFFGKLAWELNHIFLKKNFFVAGVTFPLLYLLACLDLAFTNQNGLGTAILAKKG